MPFVTSWERAWIERGKLETILRHLAIKIGELGEEMTARIRQLPAEKLDQLSEALLGFNEPQDLEKWLRRRTRTRKRG